MTVISRRCCWQLAGRGQGCCSAPYHAQNRPTARHSPAQTSTGLSWRNSGVEKETPSKCEAGLRQTSLFSIRFGQIKSLVCGGEGKRQNCWFLEFLQKSGQIAEPENEKGGLKGMRLPSNVHFILKLAFGRGLCVAARRKRLCLLRLVRREG